MVQSCTSLPPQVEGVVRGTLTITFASDISWSLPSPSQNFRARISWWGNPSGVYDEVLLGEKNHEGGLLKRVVFPLRSSQKHVANYLKDAGSLNIVVLEGNEAPKAIADAPLSLADVNDTGSFAGDVPLLCRRTKQCMGSINIRVATEYVRDTHKHHAGPASSISSRKAAPMVEELATPEVDDLLPQDTQKLNTNDSADILPPSCDLASHKLHTVAVTIESAFQLPDQTLVYVSAAWQGDRSRKAFTPMTAVHDVLSLGLTAVWHYTVEVGIPFQEFEKAAMVLASSKPGTCSSSPTLGIMDGPLVLLHLWRWGGGNIVDIGGPADALPTTEPTPFDTLIGCAALDLSHLVEYPFLHSRFPIVSARHEVCGAVKARVEPSEDLAAALNALCPSRRLDDVSALPPVLKMGEVAPVGPTSGLPAQEKASHEEEFHRETQKPFEGTVQRYAWSGSDSDDGDAACLVGVAFQGAVSCSDDDFDCQQAVPASRKAPALIMEDWLFDITRRDGASAMGEQEGDDDDGRAEESGVQRIQKDGGSSDAPRRVKFKNTLLPGVVMMPARAHEAQERPAVVNSGGVFGSRAGHQPSSSDGNNIPESSTSPALADTPTTGMPDSAFKDGDWMFGIGHAILRTPEDESDGPASRVVNQFLPMQLVTTPSVTPDALESSAKGRHGSSVSLAGPRSPTLSEVLQGLRMQTDTKE